MPIAGRTPTSGTAASSAGFSITLPSGVATGDLIVLAITNAGTTPAAAPTGWTRPYSASAGSSQNHAVYTAPYSAGLTLAFTNGNSVAAWMCQAYFQSGSRVVVDGTPIGAVNSTNNTTLPTGQPVATGGVAGDYEVLTYGWTSNATVTTTASGATMDAARAVNGTAVATVIGHANSTLGANATGTAYSHTLSASNNRKSGVGLLLMAIPNPSTAIGGISDGFRSGSLDTGLWAPFGTGLDNTPQSLRVQPPGTSGVYGGIITNASYDFTGKYAFVRFTQRLANTAGTVQSFQLQLDGSNNLEMLHLDGSLHARRTVAGSTTSLANLVWSTIPTVQYVYLQESGGGIYYFYSADGVSWTYWVRAANPFAVTALKPSILAGCYAANGAPGTALFNDFNAAPVYKSLTATAPGAATVAQALRRYRSLGVRSTAGVATVSQTLRVKRSLSGTSSGISSASGLVMISGDMDPPSPAEWQNIQGDVPNPTGTDEYGYNAIVADPFVPGTVYLGTNHQGIWRSTDGGETWTYRSTGTGSSELASGGNWTLAADAFNGAIYTTAGHGAQGCWKSTDGGVNWVDKFNSTISSLIGTNDIYAISADPFLEDHLLVTFHYYWNNPAPDSGSGICESFDGGETWTAHFPPAGSAWSAGNGAWFGNTSDTWVFGSQNDGFWITHDGGDTWTQWTALTMAHGATHALTRTPGGVLLVAVDQTVFRSTDNGFTWINVGTGLGGSYYQAVASDGHRMFTSGAFPTDGDNGDHHWFSKDVDAAAGVSWADFGPAPMSNEGQRNGPVQAAFDLVTGVIYTANWRGGVWRLQGVSPEPGALPPGTAAGSASVSGLISGGSSAPGADFLIDTFVDTDGTNLGAHLPNTGAAWQVQMWNPEDGLEIGIYSNTLTCEPFGQRHALNLAEPPDADYEVEADIKRNGNDDNKIGIRLRGVNNAGFNPPSYLALYENQTTRWVLYGWSGGQFEHDAWVDSGFTVGVTRRVKLKVTGSLLELFIDGDLKLSATDTGLTEPGLAGVYMEGGGRYDFVLDNIRAGAEGAPPGPTYKNLVGSSAGHATTAGTISGGTVAPPTGEYELVAQVRGRSPGSPFGTLFTTTDIDTTGATLLIGCYAHNENPPPTLTDSKGNTWLEAVSNTVFWGARIFYVKAPVSVGPGHTFKLEVPGTPDATFFGNLQVFAFKGADLTAPLDDTNQETNFGTTAIQPGPVDPTEDGELIITILNHNRSAAPTINAGYSTPYGYVEGDYFGYIGAHSSYLIQGGAATSDPTWSGTDGSYYSAIASFKPGVAVGPIYKDLTGSSTGRTSIPLTEPSRQRPLVGATTASSTTTASLTRKRQIAAAAQTNGFAVTTATPGRIRSLGLRTATGVATTTATPARKRLLPTVLAGGSSSTTASPARIRSLSAQSAGVAACLALLTKSSPTVPPVSAAGVATTTAAVSRRRRLAPVSATGTSSTTGTPSKVTPTATPFPANGQATATAVLSRRRTPGLVSSAGQATTSATPSRTRSLAALSAGTASTTAVAGRIRTLPPGASAGSSAVTARLNLTLGQVASNGKATVNGFVFKVTPQIPDVVSAGRATATGLLGARRLMATVSSAGKATVAAVPSRRRPLLASSAGTTTTTGQASRGRRIPNGTSVAGAVTTGQASRKRPLAGSSAGIATVSGKLAGGAMGAQAAGVATVTAQVSRRKLVPNGTAVASATTTATPTRKRTLGTVSTSGKATTVVTLSKTRRSLTATAGGLATTTATPTRRRTLTGSSAGQATLSANLIKGRARDLAATSVGTSTTLGKTSAKRWIGLITIIVGTSSTAGTLQARRSLVASSAGRATAVGLLEVEIGQEKVYWNTPGEQFVFAPRPGLAEVTWGVESDQFMPGEVSV